MLRQETQDVLALLRALADSRDTLAFGALLRGPLVGLTDDELLQITAGLPEGSTFTIRTNPASVAHPLARDGAGKLQDLRRRAKVTDAAAAHPRSDRAASCASRAGGPPS